MNHRVTSREFAVLPETHQQFLKFLAQFGGACTSSEAQKALGLTTTRGAIYALRHLEDIKYLRRIEFKEIPNAETIYAATQKLNRLFECHRNTSGEAKVIAEQVFRFSMALNRRKRALVNCWSPPEAWTLSQDFLSAARQDCKDDPVIGQTVMIPILPTSTTKKAAKQIRWWTERDPKLRVELWITNTYFADELGRELDSNLHHRIEQFVLHDQKFVTRYARWLLLKDQRKWISDRLSPHANLGVNADQRTD